MRKKCGFILFLAFFLLTALGSSRAFAISSVTTGETKKLYETTVTLQGSVASYDPAYNAVGFYYWEDDDESHFTPPEGATQVPASVGNNTTDFEVEISELDPDKRYAYMAYFIPDRNMIDEMELGEQKTFLTHLYYSYVIEPEIRNLPNKTTASDIVWPQTVEVVMTDNSRKNLPVTWDYLDFEEDTYGQYPPGWTYSEIGGYKRFDGEVVADPNHPNYMADPRGFGSEKYTHIEIEIDHPDLNSIPSIPDINLPVGSTLSDVQSKLPNSLTGEFSNGKSAELPVTWNGSTPTFDGTKAGTYTFEGELGCLIQELSFAKNRSLYGAGIIATSERDCGYNNVDNLFPSAVVKIAASTTPPVTPNPDPTPTPPVVTTPTPTPPSRTVQVVVADTLGGQTVPQPITSLIGTNLALSGTLYNTNGQPVPGVSQLTLSPNGTLNIPSSVPPGTYNLTLNVIAPSGERLAGPPAKLTIDTAGNARLDAELIDPYGIITDSRTKRPVPGVKVMLHWADTELNRSKGRVPGELVKLPELPDFPPNRNLDPQNSNDAGQYGWMVYPEGDYYIMAEKDGYLMFDSRKDDAKATFGTDSYIRDGLIHVGQTIVEYSFEIDPSSQDYLAYMRGYPDGLFRPERGVTRAEVAAILQRTMVAPMGSDKLSFTDVKASHWAHDDIVLVVTNGWMKGTGGSNFMPDQAITRGEMAQILANVYGWKEAAASSKYSDVSGHWAANAINAAVSQGAMSGYDNGTFRPDQPITRSETVTLINRLTNRPAAPELPMTWSDVPKSNANYGDIMAASVDHTSTIK